MKTRIVGTTLLLGLLVLAVAGCGAKAATSAASGPTTVNITLTEFKITSSVTSFTVGTPYHFVVTNAGQTQHELMVMPVAMGTASETSRSLIQGKVEPRTSPSRLRPRREPWRWLAMLLVTTSPTCASQSW